MSYKEFKERVSYSDSKHCGIFWVPKSICNSLKEKANSYGVDICDLVEVILRLRPTELELSVLNFIKGLKKGGYHVK